MIFPSDSNRIRLQKAWLLRLLKQETPSSRSLLRKGDSFCCMGDLLDLAVQMSCDGIWCSKEGSDYRYVYREFSSEVVLPYTFAENWLDFPSFTIESTTGEVILPYPFEEDWVDPETEEPQNVSSFGVLGSEPIRTIELANLNDTGLPKSIIGVILWAIYCPPFSHWSAYLRPDILTELNNIIRNHSRNHSKRNRLLEWKLKQYVDPIIGRLESQSTSS